jgi:hypothetical protein
MYSKLIFMVFYSTKFVPHYIDSLAANNLLNISILGVGIFRSSLLRRSCGVNDTACILNFFAYHRCLHMIFAFRNCSKIFVGMRYPPHARCMRCQWYRMHRACGVNDTACIVQCACGINDTACIVHAMSMTPHAFLKIRISSRIRIYIWKGFSPLIRSPGRMFWWKKPRVENLVTLSL